MNARLEIIEEIGKFIPPFKASFISGDGKFFLLTTPSPLMIMIYSVPYQFVSWEMKHRAKEAAKKNQRMCL